MRLAEHLTFRFALGGCDVCCQVGESPTCSVPALQGCEGLWLYDHGHSCMILSTPPSCPTIGESNESCKTRVEFQRRGVVFLKLRWLGSSQKIYRLKSGCQYAQKPYRSSLQYSEFGAQFQNIGVAESTTIGVDSGVLNRAYRMARVRTRRTFPENYGRGIDCSRGGFGCV